MLTQGASNPRVQPNELKEAAHQFQPAVRSELFVTELDRKLSLDRPLQPPYLQPHLWGLSCRLELRCCRTPNDAPEAFFLRSNRRIDQNYFRFKVNYWTVPLLLSCHFVCSFSGFSCSIKSRSAPPRPRSRHRCAGRKARWFSHSSD